MADGNTLLTAFRDALLDIVVSKDKDLPTVLAHYTTTAIWAVIIRSTGKAVL